MRLVCANHSAYPRVGDSPESQRVRRAYRDRERGDIDDAGYLEVVRDYAAEIMREQAEAGCDVVTDGQVGWYDLVIHLAGSLEGTERGDIHRFFDTNYLVRQPHVVGPVKGTFGTADDHRAAAEASPKPVKAILTGPYTLADHSIIEDSAPYDGVGALTDAYAERMADELRELSAAGCELLQIEEPSLLAHPEDAAVVRRGLETATAASGDMRVSLVTYFGDAAPLYGELREMPVDLLGFDLTYGPGVWDVLTAEGIDRPVALGAIDGRNTMPDDVDTVARNVDRTMEAARKGGVEELHLQPSCALEYLPRDRAKRKLERMREIADRVSKAGV